MVMGKEEVDLIDGGVEDNLTIEVEVTVVIEEITEVVAIEMIDKPLKKNQLKIIKSQNQKKTYHQIPIPKMIMKIRSPIQPPNLNKKCQTKRKSMTRMN